MNPATTVSIRYTLVRREEPRPDRFAQYPRLLSRV